VSQEDIENRFSYHAPDEAKIALHGTVRSDVKSIALLWDRELPDGREKSLALTKLEEAVFWANASIARN
jgi:hypothetical protein